MNRPTRSLRYVLGKIEETIWVIPGACVAAAVALSYAAEALDRGLARDRSAWFLFGGGSEGARELFSAVATSMLTFAGLVFSITILVLQLASTQFSPRALGTFLRDNGSKFALGIFIGTYVYALLGLRLVRGAGEEQEAFVPALSVWLTVPLVLVSVGTFIYYLHHVAQSIRAVVVIRRIGQETRTALERLYPEDLGDADEDELQPKRPAGSPSLRLSTEKKFGTVMEVNEEGLLRQAEAADVTLVMRARVGAFVPFDAPIFDVWGNAEAVDRDAIRRCVSIGSERTLVQDASFGFRQLVDVAGRALSPSTNDPTTAVQVLDQLHDLLRRLLNRRFPSPNRRAGDALRLVLPRPDWDDYVRLSLDEIQHWGRDSLQVRGRISAMLDDLLAAAPASRRAPLLRQLETSERNEER